MTGVFLWKLRKHLDRIMNAVATAPDLEAQFKYENSFQVPQAFFVCLSCVSISSQFISCPLINARPKVALLMVFATVVLISFHSLSAKPVWYLIEILVVFVHRLFVISSLAFLAARQHWMWIEVSVGACGGFSQFVLVGCWSLSGGERRLANCSLPRLRLVAFIGAF